MSRMRQNPCIHYPSPNPNLMVLGILCWSMDLQTYLYSTDGWIRKMGKMETSGKSKNTLRNGNTQDARRRRRTTLLTNKMNCGSTMRARRLRESWGRPTQASSASRSEPSNRVWVGICEQQTSTWIVSVRVSSLKNSGVYWIQESFTHTPSSFMGGRYFTSISTLIL